MLYIRYQITAVCFEHDEPELLIVELQLLITIAILSEFTYLGLVLQFLCLRVRQKNGGLEINFSVLAKQCGHINNIALTSCYKHIIRSTIFLYSSGSQST